MAVEFYSVSIAAVDGVRVTLHLSLYDPQVVRLANKGRPGGRRFALELLTSRSARLSREHNHHDSWAPRLIRSVHLTEAAADPVQLADYREQCDLPPGTQTDWTMVVRVREPAWIADLVPQQGRWLTAAYPTVGQYDGSWVDRNDTDVDEWADTVAAVEEMTGWSPLPPLLLEMYSAMFAGRFSPLVDYAGESCELPKLCFIKDFLPDSGRRALLGEAGLHVVGLDNEERLLCFWVPAPDTPLARCPVVVIGENAPELVADHLAQYLTAAHATNNAELRSSGRGEEAAHNERDLSGWLQEHGMAADADAAGPTCEAETEMLMRYTAVLSRSPDHAESLMWTAYRLAEVAWDRGAGAFPSSLLQPLLSQALGHLEDASQEQHTRYAAALFLGEAIHVDALREQIDTGAVSAACIRLLRRYDRADRREALRFLEDGVVQQLCRVALMLVTPASLPTLLACLDSAPGFLTAFVAEDEYSTLEHRGTDILFPVYTQIISGGRGLQRTYSMAHRLSLVTQHGTPDERTQAQELLAQLGENTNG